MVCRHMSGDPDCSKTPNGRRQREIENEEAEYRAAKRREEKEKANKRAKELYAMTPDSERYEVVDAARVGNHLVMKVLYPNCSKCSYEGMKVMVFLNVSELEALKWRKVDPHFRDPSVDALGTDAPSPAARFPASTEGWLDALAYAERK